MNFITASHELDDLSIECYKIASEKGFWEQGNNSLIVPTKLALIHSEVSEALEEARLNPVSRERLQEELADICIRCFDLAAFIQENAQNEGIMLQSFGQALCDKIAKNRERPFKHGKNF